MKRLLERIIILIIGALIASIGFLIGMEKSNKNDISVVEFDTIKCHKIEVYDEHDNIAGMISLEIDDGHPTLFMSAVSMGAPGHSGGNIYLTTGGKTARLSMDTGHKDSDPRIVLFATPVESLIEINDVKVASIKD